MILGQILGDGDRPEHRLRTSPGWLALRRDGNLVQGPSLASSSKTKPAGVGDPLFRRSLVSSLKSIRSAIQFEARASGYHWAWIIHRVTFSRSSWSVWLTSLASRPSKTTALRHLAGGDLALPEAVDPSEPGQVRTQFVDGLLHLDSPLLVVHVAEHPTALRVPGLGHDVHGGGRLDADVDLERLDQREPLELREPAVGFLLGDLGVVEDHPFEVIIDEDQGVVAIDGPPEDRAILENEGVAGRDPRQARRDEVHHHDHDRKPEGRDRP